MKKLRRTYPDSLFLLLFLTITFLGYFILMKNLSIKISTAQDFHSISPVNNVEIEPTILEDLNSEEILLNKLIDSMTLEEKVGQMFIGGGVGGNQLNSQIDLCKTYGFGGVILMKPDVIDQTTTDTNLSKLKSLSSELKAPIFIAIDEEGGVVSHLKSQMPEQTSQPQIVNYEQASVVAHYRGIKLNELGINVVFAPVMDYAMNSTSFLYKRTFHVSKDEIFDISKTMIEVYSNNSVIAVAKHYPGHPDTPTDSHKNIPQVAISSENFSEYTSQFKKLAESGNAEIIMSGHILFPEIDSNISSLSNIIITDKLRNEFGFEGVIITDDMNMGAVKNQYSTDQAAILAVQAGNDILLYVTNPETQIVAYKSVLAAVQNGTISEERINESVYRILKLKQKYLITEEQQIDLNEQ